jgi:hypothetical protein
MDIQKAAGWANVGSFAVGCIALYFMWTSLHTRTAESGVAQPMTSFSPLMWAFLSLLILSGVLHFSAALIQRKGVHNITPIATSIAATPRIAGRDFVGASITPEYLLGFFSEHTAIQASKLIEPFIGKWLRISGNLSQILSSSPDRAQLTFSGRGVGDDLASVFMYFRDEGEVERLAILRRGDRLTVVGRITEINTVQIDLDDCELER